MTQPRRVKAKYRTVGPKREKVSFTKAYIDKETKSLQQEQAEEERDCYYVYFPQGHSIRLTGDAGLKELKRLGYHKRPRMVDMDTGDLVDIGGQEYDFSIAPDKQPDANSVLLEENIEEEQDPEPPVKGKEK